MIHKSLALKGRPYFSCIMTDDEVRRILDSVDEALSIYRRNHAVLSESELKLKSTLMLVRSVIANELRGEAAPAAMD